MDMNRRPVPETMGLPKIRQPNLKSRVYELLLNMIIDGKYRDNDMLPPERMLCEELGVSRTVIREAIESLETRGVLQVIHGKGIKVVPSSSSDISNAVMLYLRRRHHEVSMRDLIEMRLAVETEVAAHAALRAEEPHLRELRAILDRMAKATADTGRYVLADLDFHLKLAYATRNILFATILEALLVPLRQSFEESFEMRDNEQTWQEHAGIYQSVESRDAERARKLMVEHLEHAERVLKSRGKL